ncbi:hypothetical protein KKF61_09110 [Patescibacteria group bacterium]|nr:hypothetical protein [Patescibacteria group bacterium]
MKIDITKGWLPDIIPYELPDGGLIECKNLLPYDEYYAPAYGKVAYSTDAVSGTPIFGKVYKDSQLNNYLFIGTSTKLYKMGAAKSVTDITRTSGGAYSATTWSFEQYGDWIIMTDFVDAPQILKEFGTANVVVLGGSPPLAKYVLLHRGHLIFGYVNESGVIGPKKLVWSALESIEDYTPSLTTGSDFQNLPDADGEITGMANIGDFFAVFHKNSVTLAWYAGSPFTFNFAVNRIKNIGAIPGTILSIGAEVFFWSENDIYKFDGSTITPLGFGIRQAILDNMHEAYKHLITSVHDSGKGIIYWCYCTTSSTGVPDRILAYNYRTGKFTHIDITASCIFDFFASAGYDADTIATIYPDLEVIPYSLDSNYWNPNTPALGCIDNTTSKVAIFAGTVLTGELETKEMYAESKILHINRVRPKVSNTTDAVNVKVGGREKEGDSVSYTSLTPVGSNGYVDLRKTGRFLRINVQTGIHGGLQSLEADIKEVGKR